MNKRKSISKKLRFEVFKRDSFTCQYCSNKPPNVALEVDHIQPVSKGGGNEIDNLLTACFDCNRGKSNNELQNIPTTLSDKAKAKQIALEQYKEYLKILKRSKKQLESQIDLVQQTYQLFYEDYSFTNKFRVTVKKFIQSLDVETVIDAMERACFKVHDDYDQVLKYFCGICWYKIRENEQ